MEPEPEYIEVKKIIQNYVKTPLLHCYFGIIPADKIDPNLNYVYIIRKSSLDLEVFGNLEDALSEMPQRFVVGSIKGSLIYNMKNILNDVRIWLFYNFDKLK